MNDKKLLFLFRTFVVLGAAAILIHHEHTGDRKDREKTLLKMNLSDIQRVQIDSPEGTLDVRKSRDTWVMHSLADYPVDFIRLRAFMLSLENLKPGEPVMGGENMLDEFGLNDQAVRVRWYGDSDKVLSDLQLGNDRISETPNPMGLMEMPDGVYARVGEGPVQLLARGLRGLPHKPLDWIDTALLQIPARELETVTLQPSSGNDCTLKINGARNYTLVGADSSASLNLEKAEELAGAFSYLTFNNVEAASHNFNPDTRLELSLKNGLKVNIEIESSQHRLRIQAGRVPPPAPSEENALAAFKEQQAAAQQTLQKLQSRSGWIYTLEPYAVAPLQIQKQDLIVAKPTAKTPPSPTPFMLESIP